MEEEQVIQTQENQAAPIETVIEELKKNGATKEQIFESLKKLLEEGKITQEDFDLASKNLTSEEEEKTQASSLFGVNL